jgi:hypothetical protein
MILNRPLWREMEPDKQPREAWENGVALGDAWWAFADTRNKNRFRELQQAASPADLAPHMGFRHALEDEVIGRLCSGELQAFGIEFRSAGDPIALQKNYFWKGAKIDFDNGTVTSLGRKFGQVTVQGKREPIIEILPEVIEVDPQQLQANRAKLLTEPSLPEDQCAILEPVSPAVPLPSAPASQELIDAARRGRPSKEDKIGEAIDILLKRGIDLAKLSRPQAMAEIRKCATSELKSDVNIGFSDPVLQRVLFRRFGPRG